MDEREVERRILALEKTAARHSGLLEIHRRWLLTVVAAAPPSLKLAFELELVSWGEMMDAAEAHGLPAVLQPKHDAYREELAAVRKALKGVK